MKRFGLVAGGICLVLGATALALGVHDWAFVIEDTHVAVYPGYALALTSLMILFIAARRLLLRNSAVQVAKRSR